MFREMMTCYVQREITIIFGEKMMLQLRKKMFLCLKIQFRCLDIGYVYTNNKFIVFRFVTFINAQYIYFVVALGPNDIGENQCRLQLHNAMQHQHMSSSGFDSPPILSMDISKVVKTTNVISTLVNGTNTKAQH